MIDFTTAMPLQDAVEQISRRTPMGNTLSSAEWDLVPAEIRLRTMWAARLESEKLAADMQRRLAQRIALERSKLADGKEGVTMDRRRFIDEMRVEFKKAGYRPEPGKEGTLQDFTSAGRLGLIWNMNLAQAEGYAQWKTAMDPDILRATPAWEFKRLENRLERRNWPVIWRANGGQFYPGPSEYPEGRMIALKTSDIWVKISRFGVPWKPFDWGSGMGTRNVRRKECLELGILKAGEVQTPLQVPFNQGAQASLKGISPARRRAIEDDFRGDVEIEGDVIRLLPPQSYGAMGGEPPLGNIPKASFDNKDQPAPPVSPKRLEETISVEKGLLDRKARQEVKEAISIISGVHGDGVLPQMMVLIRRFFSNPTKAGHLTATPSPAAAPELIVSPDAKDVLWTAIHEIGHLLDNQGLHTPSDDRLFASQGQPELKGLMRAIRNTRTYHEILARSRQARTDYFVRPQELFARAYTQFIAEESGDARLAARLAAIQEGRMEDLNVWKESQWNPAQFAAIREEMREVLKQLKWRYDQ
jgi:hypothetical protein